MSMSSLIVINKSDGEFSFITIHDDIDNADPSLGFLLDLGCHWW